jgi:uncharacterized Zn-binding protein involved in type VI secretion
MHEVSQAVDAIATDAGTVANIAGMIADPEGALLGQAADLMEQGLTSATNAISAMVPAFPAVTLGSMALGLPHAHVAHPPSGPPPMPPIPLPPFGPVLLGTCVQVLINSKPAARCGDIGLSPTCCGLPPMFEILTGSSKVFIGGARAARAGIDITMHCKPSLGGTRARAMAAKIAAKASMLRKIAALVGEIGSAAGAVAQVAAIAAEAAEAEADSEDDPALSAALGLSAGMTAAQMAADAAAMAASAAMGKDPVMPPTGTPGMILMGSPNVLIGGVPLPATMAIAQGLLKRVKGRRHGSSHSGRSRIAAPPN